MVLSYDFSNFSVFKPEYPNSDLIGTGFPYAGFTPLPEETQAPHPLYLTYPSWYEDQYSECQNRRCGNCRCEITDANCSSIRKPRIREHKNQDDLDKIMANIEYRSNDKNTRTRKSRRTTLTNAYNQNTVFIILLIFLTILYFY